MQNKLTTVDLIKPVPPGVSWTAPEKGRPWSQPPKLVKVFDVAQGYIDNLSSPSVVGSIIDAIETKAPLASLAEALMLSSVNKGIHTIDTGILAMPVIIEMLKTAAEMHGVDYVVFPDELEEPTISEKLIRDAIKEASTKKEVVEAAPAVELTGLMARKSKVEMNDGI